MINKFFKFIFFVSCILFMYYLLLPSPNFPSPPMDSLQSKEPADTETPLRRAYFTNYTREEVMGHYKNEFNGGIRLNYPPEESATIIRDQTRSTFLEEIVHPFRESIYVNGFEPVAAKDAIEIEGKMWRQKIIVRYVNSNLSTRLLVGVLAATSFYLVTFHSLKILLGKSKRSSKK